MSEHHRYLIGWHLRLLDEIEAKIAELDQRIEAQIAALSRRHRTLDRHTRHQAGGGVGHHRRDRCGHEHLPDCRPSPELGPDRADESAGKKRSRRVKKGGAWLKPVLVQCARAAARKRGSYYGAQYRRLKARIGDQKAIIAVAASILTAIYHMLRDGTEHADLGAAYLSRREGDSKAIAHQLARRIRALGYQVDLREAA